jgi:hypothetical protein
VRFAAGGVRTSRVPVMSVAAEVETSQGRETFAVGGVRTNRARVMSAVGGVRTSRAAVTSAVGGVRTSRAAVTSAAGAVATALRPARYCRRRRLHRRSPRSAHPLRRPPRAAVRLRPRRSRRSRGEVAAGARSTRLPGASRPGASRPAARPGHPVESAAKRVRPATCRWVAARPCPSVAPRPGRVVPGPLAPDPALAAQDPAAQDPAAQDPAAQGPAAQDPAVLVGPAVQPAASARLAAQEAPTRW